MLLKKIAIVFFLILVPVIASAWTPENCIIGPGNGVAGGPSSDNLSSTGQNALNQWKLFRWPASASGNAYIFSVKMVEINGGSKVASCQYAVWDDNAGSVGNLKIWGYKTNNTFNANTREYFDMNNIVTNRSIISGKIYWIGFRSSLGNDGSAFFERQGSDPIPAAVNCQTDGCIKVGVTIANENDFTQTPPSNFDVEYAPNYYGWAVWTADNDIDPPPADTVPPAAPLNLITN